MPKQDRDAKEKLDPRTGDENSEEHLGKRVLVGQPWPAEIEVQVTRSRRQALSWLRNLFSMLLLGLTAYWMFTGNQEMLQEIFELVKLGLTAVLIWAAGLRPGRVA